MFEEIYEIRRNAKQSLSNKGHKGDINNKSNINY
jgi:hypothetical protein